jgi:hypothetical protein
MPRPIRRVTAVTLAAAAVGALGGAGVAHANQQEVKILIGGLHTAWGEANMSNAGNGMERHSGVRVGEASPVWDTVCNYNGQVSAVIPGMNGDQFLQRGNHHRDCSFLAGWKDFPNWDGLYPRGTGIRTKWTSDETPGGTWVEIGVLRD